MRHRLILLRASGSGKTTTARALTNRLRGWGVPARLGGGPDGSPLDLFGRRIWGPGALDELAWAYPGRGRDWPCAVETLRRPLPDALPSRPCPEGLSGRWRRGSFAIRTARRCPCSLLWRCLPSGLGPLPKTRASASVTVCESALLQHQIRPHRLLPSAAPGRLRWGICSGWPRPWPLWSRCRSTWPRRMWQIPWRTAAQRVSPSGGARAGYLAQRAELGTPGSGPGCPLRAGDPDRPRRGIDRPRWAACWAARPDSGRTDRQSALSRVAGRLMRRRGSPSLEPRSVLRPSRSAARVMPTHRSIRNRSCQTVSFTLYCWG